MCMMVKRYGCKCNKPMEFLTELKKIGLTDKEAAVYLALLQMGPSPVQLAARKSKVVRATTYVVLEALAKKGLVTQFKEGKKTLFSAESPRQLLRVLEKQEEEIREKERELEVMLPELQVLMKSEGDRPSVRYFEGEEGIRAIRQEIIMYAKPGSIIRNLTPADYLEAQFPHDRHTYFKQRVAKRVRSKTIFTTTSQDHKDRLLSAEFAQLSERIYVSPEYFSSAGAITVFGDRVAMSSYVGETGGVIIESKTIANTMQDLHRLAWEGALKVGVQQASTSSRK